MKKFSIIFVILTCLALILLTGCKTAPEPPETEATVPVTEEKQESEFAATKGTWKPTTDWEGAVSVIRIEMDGEGNFKTYLEDDSVKASGTLRRAEENNAVRYDMYDEAGNYVDGFYIQENGQLMMVEGAAATYEK